MIFESKLKRALIANIILSLVPDLILSAIITAIFKGEEAAIIIFIIVFFGLQLLHLALWILRSLMAWIPYWIGGRKKMATAYCDYLYEHEFPNPKDFEESPEVYFGSVLINNKLTPELRLKAASTLGEYEAYRNAGQYQMLLRISFALEDAIVEYKRGFTRRKVRHKGE